MWSDDATIAVADQNNQVPLRSVDTKPWRTIIPDWHNYPRRGPTTTPAALTNGAAKFFDDTIP